MASLSSTCYHARSNSLPSSQGVVLSQVDDRLRLSKSVCSVGSKLTQLSGLYVSVEELLQLPSSRRSLSCQDKSVDRSLEASIKLMDACSHISDVLAQMKERAQGLQSILRRRCSKEETAREVARYLRSRSKAIKNLAKELKNLKKMDTYSSKESSGVISRLGESQRATRKVLECVLVEIVGPDARRSNWGSVVSRLCKSRRVGQGEASLFVVGLEGMEPKKAMKGLERMEMGIKDVEQGLEGLFRHLIRTRTVILNILNC